MEDVFAVGHHGIIGDLRTCPRHPAYNRCSHWRVTWDMRCARSPDNQMPSVDLRGIALSLTRIADSILKHVPAGTTRGSSASVVESLVICRPAAQHRTLPSPSNRRAGTCNLITGHSATETTIRETLRRLGPHPHWSIGTSFDPLVILMHHIDLIHSVTGYQYNTYSSTNEVMYRNMRIIHGLAKYGITGGAFTWIGPSRWTISKLMKISCKYRVRVTGSWRDGLVDSGSAVNAVSQSFYKTLVEAGAPVGDLQTMVRRLCGANGSQIDISGCSSCVVSFLGLRTELLCFLNYSYYCV